MTVDIFTDKLLVFESSRKLNGTSFTGYNSKKNKQTSIALKHVLSSDNKYDISYKGNNFISLY